MVKRLTLFTDVSKRKLIYICKVHPLQGPKATQKLIEVESKGSCFVTWDFISSVNKTVAKKKRKLVFRITFYLFVLI